MMFIKINNMVGIEADIAIYFRYAGNILGGLIPYRDFTLEYPPGALPVFILPRLAAGDLLEYRRLFVAEMMAVDFIGLLLVMSYLRRKDAWSAGYMAGMSYVLLPAVLGFVTYQRFDLVPAVMVLAALVLYDRDRRIAAWSLLGLGFAVKLYPVILAPVFLITAYRENKLPKDLFCGVPAAILTAAIVWVPVMAAAGRKFWAFLAYHGMRGIQLESLYAVFIIVARWFGYPASTRFAFGAWNIEAPVSQVLAGWSLPVMAFLMAVVVAHMLMVSGRRGWDRDDLPRVMTMMVMAFLLGGKVLSPQFLLWVIPLLVTALKDRPFYRNLTCGLFAVIAFLSYFIYPVHYKGLIDLEPSVSAVLILRNVLLAVVFYLLFKSGNISRETRKIREIYPNRG